LYKVIFILSIIFISAGCSVFKQTESSEFRGSEDRKWKDVEELIVKHNITDNNFFINKARIEVVTEDVKESFLATIKFIIPDTFLISLRSKAGIEAARIFFTSDTILINDRINRKLLFGKPAKAGRKFSISPEIVPVLLGDFIGESVNQFDNECFKGRSNIYTAINGNILRFIIDCNKAKVVSVSRESSNSKTQTVIEFDKFIRLADKFYPSIINIHYSEIMVNIKLDKVEYPWKGNIEFIPGNNYELVELL